MEEICRSLCAKICEAGTGEYEIFFEDELLEALPDDLKNRETLEAALKKLNTDGYVDVKYARGNAFCIAAIKNYEEKAEPAQPLSPAPAAVPAISIGRKVYLAIALSAFAGSAIGGIILAIVGAVI